RECCYSGGVRDPTRHREPLLGEMRHPWGKRLCKLMTAAMLVPAGIAFVSQALAETLIIQGSTTFNRRLMEPHRAAIEADAKHELTVIPNKSMPGLIALMEGRAHMAMISASLKSEISILTKIMHGLAYDRLQAHEVMNTRIALVTHPSNQVRKASLHEIRKMVLGEITNWSMLGGKDEAIRVVLVGGGGGVTTVMEAELLGDQSAKGPHILYVRTPIQL